MIEITEIPEKIKELVKNRHVIVTGAGSGIGRALALGFVFAGADVALIGRTESKLKAVAEEIRNICPDRSVFIGRADVRNYEELKEVFEKAEENLGSISVLINNAGFSKIKPITRLRVEEFTEMIDTNIKGVYNGTHIIVPSMIENKGGVILSTGSVAVNYALPGWSAYAMTKSALLSFTECLAAELKKYKIRVNNIMPNMVHTPMLHSGRTPEQIAAMEAMQPEELIPYYVFLASDSAKRMTGLNIPVDTVEAAVEFIIDKGSGTFKEASEELERHMGPNEYKIVKKCRKLVDFLVELRKK